MILLKRRKLCKCGCGNYIKSGNFFIHGHNGKGKKRIFIEQWKKNISEATKKALENPLIRRKISDANKRREIPNRRGAKHTLESRKKMSESHKELYQDPVIRAKMSLAMKEASKKYGLGKVHSKFMKDKWQDIEYRNKIRVTCKRTGNKKKKAEERWKNLEFKMKVSKKMKEAYQDPKLRLRVSERVKKQWQDPNYIIAHSGFNHHNWEGGISFEPYSPEWKDELKKFIKERDNYQCQNLSCLNNSKRLTVHHIDYDKKNCKPDNLITLCNSCNTRANYGRDYWEEFYQNIMEEKDERSRAVAY